MCALDLQAGWAQRWRQLIVMAKYAEILEEGLAKSAEILEGGLEFQQHCI